MSTLQQKRRVLVRVFISHQVRKVGRRRKHTPKCRHKRPRQRPRSSHSRSRTQFRSQSGTQTQCTPRKMELRQHHNLGLNMGGKAVLQEKFNAVLPRSRSYFGLKRRTFLIVVACAFLALLALIIGLAVGLTKHSKGWVRFNVSKVALTDVLLVDRICHFRQTASSMKEILPTTVLV